MRIAALSDIHGNLLALDAVIGALDALGGIDAVWILGDLAAFGPQPQACIRRVQELQNEWGAGRVSVISGNTDRYLVTGARRAVHLPITSETFHSTAQDIVERDLSLHWTLAQLAYAEFAYLRELPSEISLDVPGYGRVIGYHGTPGNDEGWLTKTTSDAEIASLFAQQTAGRLGLGGHTHEPMDRSWQGWRLLNVGSVGAPRAGRGAEYCVMTFAGGAVRAELLAVPFDTGAVAWEIDRIGTPPAMWMKRKMHLSKESRRG